MKRVKFRRLGQKEKYWAIAGIVLIFLASLAIFDNFVGVTKTDLSPAKASYELGVFGKFLSFFISSS